jgi:NADPH:quinone reductase-like Zn-dependent oxidoreductase
VKAVYAQFPSPREPLAGLRYGDQPEPFPPDDGWEVMTVRAAALNHHDLWTLRGAGLPASRFPMILGCEASGLDAGGREVIAVGLLADPRWQHDPARDPAHTVLSEGAPGTFAECVAVPRRLLMPKPDWLSFAEAACLTVWLTAYRMLYTKADLRPGQTVLVQGAGGGLCTALISLARASGLRVLVTSRSDAKREAARRLGAHAAFRTGEPLPAQVDAVMESVGRATWSHSVRAVRPGGVIVVTGATTGADPPACLSRLFWQEIRVVGSTCGTPDELGRLLAFMADNDLRPLIAARLPFASAGDAFRLMAEGEVIGKIVFTG